MNNVECESCIKRKTMYCPNSFKCYATKDKPYWQNRIMLLEESNQLKEQYCERTDCAGRLGNSRKVERLIQENKELQEKYNIRSKAYNNILLENASLHNKIDKAIDYIEKHKVNYFNESVLYATEFDSISSPHYLLSILKDSDIDE